MIDQAFLTLNSDQVIITFTNSDYMVTRFTDFLHGELHEMSFSGLLHYDSSQGEWTKTKTEQT